MLVAGVLWFLVALLTHAPSTHAAEALRIPVLVPLTGFLALEGTSQRNGAVLALTAPPANLTIQYEVQDTATAPESAVNALAKALGPAPPFAVVASMLGTQILAMLPLAAEREVPLLTVSGTAQVTEMGNPWVFRFFPNDAAVKVAHARYVVEELGLTRPAILYQTTAYGQSGYQHLTHNFGRLGATVAMAEALAPTVRDYTPALAKVAESKADVLVLHLHAGPTALAIRQAREMGLKLPIVAGSALHQPSTAALLDPAELAGTCAETASSPISGGSPEIERFAAEYQQRFGAAPDAYALAQYDGVRMALAAAAAGADTPAKLRAALSKDSYAGLAMTYRSDGAGNMAHEAVIICYQGKDRIPRIVKRYRDLDRTAAQ